MVTLIQQELLQLATPERKKSIEFFFKHDIKAYGVSNPDTQKIGRSVVQIIKKEEWPKDKIWKLAEQLFKNGSIEESLLACQVVVAFKREYSLDDFGLFAKWVNLYIDNWAECDTFCNKVIGEMLFRFPELVSEMKMWALSDNLWVRRASAVSFIYPAKKNMFVEDQLEIALLLLEDQEDMVQKGYGWMLKVLSQNRQKEVFDFVQRYKARMPRTALRYAIEKMPAQLKKQAMEK
jgi:3-methyladenine DNA glycosylase AlkD